MAMHKPNKSETDPMARMIMLDVTDEISMVDVRFVNSFRHAAKLICVTTGSLQRSMEDLSVVPLPSLLKVEKYGQLADLLDTVVHRSIFVSTNPQHVAAASRADMRAILLHDDMIEAGSSCSIFRDQRIVSDRTNLGTAINSLLGPPTPVRLSEARLKLSPNGKPYMN